MDATLASLEAKAGQVKADSKVKADQLGRRSKEAARRVSDPSQERRPQASEAALQSQQGAVGIAVESLRSAGQNLLSTRSASRSSSNRPRSGRRAAQVKAWREAADTFQDVATKFAAGRRATSRSPLKDEGGCRRGGSAIAEAETGGKRILGGAERGLAESRKAFDRANQAAWDAVKRAASFEPLKGIHPRAGFLPIVVDFEGEASWPRMQSCRVN